MKKLLVLLGMGFLSFPSWAAYKKDLGDLLFFFEVGMLFPVFVQDLQGNIIPPRIGPSDLVTQRTTPIGGMVNLGFDLYIGPNWHMGPNVILGISSDINNVPIFFLPISWRTAYDIRFSSFKLPIFLDLGVAMIVYNSLFTIAPMIRPGLGFEWQYSANWSFGIALSYWWIAEVVPSMIENSRFLNVIDLNLVVSYYF